MVERVRLHAAHVRLRLRAFDRARRQHSFARRGASKGRRVPQRNRDERAACRRLVGLSRFRFLLLLLACADSLLAEFRAGAFRTAITPDIKKLAPVYLAVRDSRTCLRLRPLTSRA